MINNSIIKELQSSKKSFLLINILLKNKIIKFDNRKILFSSYFHINMDHFQSIQLLIENKLYSSAFALVRTFYETYYRALWVLRCINGNQVLDIINNKYRFPEMNKIIIKLDTIYTNTDFFKNLKKSTWKSMCDYAHSGILQISRRWTKDKLEPNYEDTEIIEVIKGTKLIFLLFAYILCKDNGFNQEIEK